MNQYDNFDSENMFGYNQDIILRRSRVKNRRNLILILLLVVACIFYFGVLKKSDEAPSNDPTDTSTPINQNPNNNNDQDPPMNLNPNQTSSSGPTMSYKLEFTKKVDIEGIKEDPISPLTATFKILDQKLLQLKIFDEQNPRWEMKDYGKSYVPSSSSFLNTFNNNYQIFFEDDPFFFKIVEKSSGAVILKYYGEELKFSNYYIEFGLELQTERIFGLGERIHHFLMNPGTYTLFNKDAQSPIDHGTGGDNLYSSHPFLLSQLDNYQFIGIFFNNINAQDIVINSKPKVVYKTVGGIIDFYFFLGDSAENVLKQYHQMIGLPYLPPYWSLGYHQCRWGYESLGNLRSVLEDFEENDVPIDVIWTDIDAMDNKKLFTLNPRGYKKADFPKFSVEIAKKNIHYIPIVDAGIKKENSYKYYNLGVEKDAFVKSAKSLKPLVGRVWPGDSCFLDFFHPDANSIWQEGLKDLHEMTMFDGIWLDMNEASNFVDGEENMGINPNHLPEHDPMEFDHIPYYPGNTHLNKGQLAMTGFHYSTNEYEDKYRKEYNVHNMYGYMTCIATAEYFTQKLKQRPFIISRSTMPGSGSYASHWLGDNFSRWDYMKYTIAGVLNFQLFGIPIVGADICGFFEGASAELCLRWFQLGLFYTFSRNHNHHEQHDQEPTSKYYLDSEAGSQVLIGAKNAIRQKYSLLRYYYTLLFQTATEGGTVLRPLLFEFPEDQNTLLALDNNFMIGSAVLLSPVLEAKVDSIKTYFPNCNWYDLRTGERIITYNEHSEFGLPKALNASVEYVNLHIRGGQIIPYQDALPLKVKNVEELSNLPIILLVALDHHKSAKGTMVVDDGISPKTIENKKYSKYNFLLENSILTINIENTFEHEAFPNEVLEYIKIVGASLTMEPCKNPTLTDTEGTTHIISCKYNYESEIALLQIPATLELPLFQISQIHI